MVVRGVSLQSMELWICIATDINVVQNGPQILFACSVITNCIQHATLVASFHRYCEFYLQKSNLLLFYMKLLELNWSGNLLVRYDRIFYFFAIKTIPTNSFYRNHPKCQCTRMLPKNNIITNITNFNVKLHFTWIFDIIMRINKCRNNNYTDQFQVALFFSTN